MIKKLSFSRLREVFLLTTVKLGGGYKYSSAGGSGYIGNSSLSNKVMYCYNCTESTDSDTYTISTTEAYSSPISNTAKIGDGAAKITFAGDDYLDLEYIKSTGTQYIDLDYIPKTTTKVEMDIKFEGTFCPENDTTKNCGSSAFFGSYESTTGNAYGINFGSRSDQFSTIFPYVDLTYAKGENESYPITISDVNVLFTKNKLTFKSGEMTYGIYSTDDQKPLPEKTKDQETSMYIFTYNDGNIIPFGSYNMYLYDLKVYEGEKLVRWYIPSLKASSGSAGLYEVIEEKFYENKGEEEFVYN